MSEKKMQPKPYDCPLQLFQDTVAQFPRKEKTEDHLAEIFYWLSDKLQKRKEGQLGSARHSCDITIDCVCACELKRCSLSWQFFAGLVNFLPIPLGGMKCQGKLEERFPKRAWAENIEFLSKMRWLQVIVKPVKDEMGAIVWDVPELCRQWIGPKGRWCQDCDTYDKKLQEWVKQQKPKGKSPRDHNPMQ